MTSAGATTSASPASCSAAPAVSDRMSTGSCSPTRTASLATRFIPSTIGLTSDDVGDPQGRDRHRVVGAVVDPDRLLVGFGQAVDPGHDLADRGAVLGVLGNRRPRRRLDGDEPDPLSELRPALEQLLEGQEAAQGVLRRLDPIGPDDDCRIAGPLESGRGAVPGGCRPRPSGRTGSGRAGSTEIG